MPNKYLKPIYFRLFNEQFDYSQFAMRLKMQKGIYLLEELGVDIGDFAFSWYKHGPYSQSLQDEMFSVDRVDRISNTSNTSVQFSKFASENIEKLHQCFSYPHNGYSDQYWVECLASVHFLRKNILPSSCEKKDIVDKLSRLKPHLKSNELNNMAIDLIYNIYNFD